MHCARLLCNGGIVNRRGRIEGIPIRHLRRWPLPRTYWWWSEPSAGRGRALPTDAGRRVDLIEDVTPLSSVKQHDQNQQGDDSNHENRFYARRHGGSITPR